MSRQTRELVVFAVFSTMGLAVLWLLTVFAWSQATVVTPARYGYGEARYESIFGWTLASWVLEATAIFATGLLIFVVVDHVITEWWYQSSVAQMLASAFALLFAAGIMYRLYSVVDAQVHVTSGEKDYFHPLSGPWFIADCALVIGAVLAVIASLFLLCMLAIDLVMEQVDRRRYRQMDHFFKQPRHAETSMDD